MRKKETPPKEQKGFYIGPDGNFVPPHSKGSGMIKPPEEPHHRRKRPSISEMPPGQQWAQS